MISLFKEINIIREVEEKSVNLLHVRSSLQKNSEALWKALANSIEKFCLDYLNYSNSSRQDQKYRFIENSIEKESFSLEDSNIAYEYGSSQDEDEFYCYKNFEKLQNLTRPIKNELNETSSFIDPSRLLSMKKDICLEALKIIFQNSSNVLSFVYLISKKSGELERICFYGKSSNGDDIDEEWLLPELQTGNSDYLENSLEYQALSRNKYSEDNQGYGEIKTSSRENIEGILKPSFKSREIEKNYFGIALPLNGSNKTFGVLKILYLAPKTSPRNEEACFEKGSYQAVELDRLFILSKDLSHILFDFKRDTQIRLLEHFNHCLTTGIPSGKSEFKEFCKGLLDLLILNPENSFRAGILRIMDYENPLDTGSFILEPLAISLGEKVTKDRDNDLRKHNDEEFLWNTAVKQEIFMLDDIQSMISLLNEKQSFFRNVAWIAKNNFQSFGCFPLIINSQTVGTFSVYTGQNSKLSNENLPFLRNIVSILTQLIYNFIVQEKAIAQRNELEAKFIRLTKQWKEETVFLSSITEISNHHAYQEIIGLGKDVLPFIFNDLCNSQEVNHWFWALNAITGENPVKIEERGIVEKMKQAWISWGDNNGYGSY